jgi:tetratricopeptide (TPR) repeat protein
LGALPGKGKCLTRNPISSKVFKDLTGHRYYPVSLLSVFFLILVGYFITWPIVMYDTDLWYHLTGGRYFWQNGTIANDAFFSYIAPSKSWYNYYWLFQAVIYKIFQWTGYYGLVLLRCLLYFLTAFFISRFFLQQRENRTELLIGLSLFICCTIVILNRELLVRPHLFSYLFIVLFLYILECRREKIWLLPLLGVFWSNLHGIEYPVMFLIVFAYIAEIYWRQLRKKPPADPTGHKEKWLLIAVFYTIFLTPGAIELVQTPFAVSFQSAAHQNLYVAELLPFSFRNLFVFAPVTMKGLISSLQNIIVLLAAFFFLISLWKRKLRISHAILFFCSILLLAKHIRFTCEFTLLSLPLLRHGTHLIAENDRFPRRFVGLALPAAVILLPILIFSSEFGNRPVYPFSESNLPAGVVRFLNSHTPGGRILNEPNTGGYLPWALGQKFKIYMDMQMTIFSDTDFATAHNAFFDPNVFKAFIQRYDPSFISVSLNRYDFKKVVATDARFVPVFFDHAELLYVNRDHYRGLADDYGLKAIDPFRFREIKYDDLSAETLSRMSAEAARMVDQDPMNFSANQIICGISVARRQYDQALSHADGIIRYYPELSHGYSLKADALFGMERYEEAARLYQKAMDMGQTAKPENVYWNLHAAYVKLKEYKKAYRLLSKYVNPFAPNTDYRDIYQLAMSAASVGNTGDAVTFLKIARMKTPTADMEHIQKIDKNLLMLGSDIR